MTISHKMTKKNNSEPYIHKFKLMNGNFTLCERPFRTIVFNSECKEYVAQIREVSKFNQDVTCRDCNQILRGEHNIFRQIQIKQTRV